MNKRLSLLELLIILVVIALLISAVRSGNNLIHQAKLDSVIKDIGKYSSLVEQFKATYRFFPGDMIGGYELWGASCGATKAKCEGNGNGKVEAPGRNDDHNEYNRVFHHMSLANMLPGFIDSSHGTNIVDLNGSICNEGFGAISPGVNSPEFVMSGGTLALAYDKDQQKHKWIIGQGPKCGYPLYSLFTPRGAKEIDQKLDDGIYDQGNLLIYNGESSGSQITDCINFNELNLSQKNPACRLDYYGF